MVNLFHYKPLLRKKTERSDSAQRLIKICSSDFKHQKNTNLRHFPAKVGIELTQIIFFCS